MKPQNSTTENTEKKSFRVLRKSVTSIVRTSQKDFPLRDITEKIIACALEVHSTLGPGLLESVYEEALAHEFTEINIVGAQRGEEGAIMKLPS